MRDLKPVLFAVIATVVLICVTGCQRFSPYVGAWSGEAKLSPNAPAIMALPLAMVGNVSGTLTLNPDGRGFLKMSVAPEQAITWSVDDGSLVLHRSDAAPGGGTGPGASSSGGNLVGHLSGDRQTLTIDLGPMSMEMHRAKG